MPFKFEKLKIWQASLEIADEIDEIIKLFPSYELYSLSSQMRRAGNSISLNIVEGSTGQSNAEFKRFLRFANRSALEVVGCLYLAKRRKYISEDGFTSLYSHIEELVKMIQALINSLND